MEVRESQIDGKGLFAVRRLAAKRKIGEMVGDRVSQRVARRRIRNKRRFAVVELGDGTAIDATSTKGFFRYINHSCSPNAFIRICRGHVEFYSLRTIQPGEEITCNYGETHHNGTLRCNCGSAGCRGYL